MLKKIITIIALSLIFTGCIVVDDGRRGPGMYYDGRGGPGGPARGPDGPRR